MTTLAFKSRYRGNTLFIIAGGPMAGKQLKLTDASVDFYERDWNGGLACNLTREEYVRDVIGGAGMLTCEQKPVTKDVVDAYRAETYKEIDLAQAYARSQNIDGMGPDYFQALREEVVSVKTGFWDNGWHRTETIQDSKCL